MNPETPPPSWSLQAQLRRQLLALLAGVWLLGSLATGLGLWRETAEVLDSALTETAQRLLLLPAAALAEPLPHDRWRLTQGRYWRAVYEGEGFTVKRDGGIRKPNAFCITRVQYVNSEPLSASLSRLLPTKNAQLQVPQDCFERGLLMIDSSLLATAAEVSASIEAINFGIFPNIDKVYVELDGEISVVFHRSW